MDDRERSDQPTDPSLNASERPESRKGPDAWQKLTAKRLADMARSLHVKLEKVFARLNEVHDELGECEGFLKELTRVIKVAQTPGSCAACAARLLSSHEGPIPGTDVPGGLRVSQGLEAGAMSPDEAAEVVRTTVATVTGIIRARSGQ